MYLQLSHACVNTLLAEEMKAMFDHIGVSDDIHADSATKMLHDVLDLIQRPAQQALRQAFNSSWVP